MALTVPRVDLPSAMTAATAVAVSTQYTEIRFEKLCPLTTTGGPQLVRFLGPQQTALLEKLN